MIVRESVRNFITQKHILELIDDSKYEQMYDECPYLLRGGVTDLLLDCDVKPDEYMTVLPSDYLCGSEIETYNISSTITRIMSSAFYDCRYLKNISIPHGVTHIDHAAFSGCSSLTEIVLPNSLIEIGYDAFKECTSLESIIIPSSVTYISSSFNNCNNLKNVDVYTTFVNLSPGAFTGCSNLNIKFAGTRSQWRQIATGKFKGCIYTCTCTDGIIKKSR